ncbi:MAG: hypothetical protein JEY99_07385 [Spirochaetales bacterium]|nr:hypothetical protein [Spirochaetales bacterium]
MIDILCMGHAAYDITYYLDEFPVEDQKYYTTKSLECGGGPSANAAVLLSRWRIPSAYGGIVGDDAFGNAIISEFERDKVDTSLVNMIPGAMTPQSAIIINAGGHRTLINRRESDGDYPYIVNEKLDAVSPQVLLADGYYPELAQAALKKFPEAPFILDGGSVHEGTKALAPHADFLLVSESFAKSWTGMGEIQSEEDMEKAVEAIAGINGRYAAITLGERGLIYASPDGKGFIPAFKVDALDTTGAGDVFHGAFAYCIFWGMDFEESLQFSALAASMSVQKEGARTSIPPLDDVLDAYERLA